VEHPADARAVTCCACEASALIPVAASLHVLSTLQQSELTHMHVVTKNARAMPSKRGISSFKRKSLNRFSSMFLLRFHDAANVAISWTELHTYNKLTYANREKIKK
jgi:hypothetical protein